MAAFFAFLWVSTTTNTQLRALGILCEGVKEAHTDKRTGQNPADKHAESSKATCVYL